MRFVKTFFLAVSSSFVLTWRTEHGRTPRAPGDLHHAVRTVRARAAVFVSVGIRMYFKHPIDARREVRRIFRRRFVTTANERPRRNSASFSLSASLSMNEYDAASPPS